MRLLVERNIAISIDNELNISAAFDNIGMHGVTKISGAYCPSLVKEFYANAVVGDADDTDIKSFVREREAMISEEMIAAVLDDDMWHDDHHHRLDFVMDQSQGVVNEPEYSSSIAL